MGGHETRRGKTIGGKRVDDVKVSECAGAVKRNPASPLTRGAGAAPDACILLEFATR